MTPAQHAHQLAAVLEAVLIEVDNLQSTNGARVAIDGQGQFTAYEWVMQRLSAPAEIASQALARYRRTQAPAPKQPELGLS